MPKHDTLLNIDQQINDIDIIPSPNGKPLPVNFNDISTVYTKNKSVVTLFEEQVNRNPEARAVVCEGNELSYSELNRRSNQLAHYLIRRGVKRDTLVPICLERSLEMIIGILGILKAGGAFVPISPDYPADRIAYMLKDTRAKLLVCNGLKVPKKFSKTRLIDIKRDNHFIDKEAAVNTAVEIYPNQLAYVIYTSGSTGKPKGVMIEHQSLSNYLSNSKARYINHETVNAGSFVHMSPTFDASLISLFTPIISGKYVVIGSTNSDESFADKNLEKYAPYDFITLTPSHLGLLPAAFKSKNGNWLANKLVIGGEMLRLNQFEPLIKEGINVEIINEYGPTETTVGCCSYSFYTLGGNEFFQNEVPIGKPIPDTQIYILNGHGQLASGDESGEIFISGAGLARGYLNQPELTAERFIKNPFSSNPDARLYKTGDWGCWLPDGNIAYLGRMDCQVKIRGYRIELGEIENILNTSGLVKQGVVLATGDNSDNKLLVGYVTVSTKFDKQALKDYLSSKLPEYMVPYIWVELDHFPLTASGKIDRKALPEPTSRDISKFYMAPRNETEGVLVSIWQELLRVPSIGIYDNFFELGGHSLLALRLASAIRRNLNMELNIRDLFIHSTIAGLARQLESKNKITSQLLIPLKATGNKIPLYIICGAGGTVFKFIDFVKLLDPEQPVYGLQQPLDSRDLEVFPNTIEGIAEMYLNEILKLNPNGPYALSGHCLGGNIAFEMAIKMKEMGKEVALLAMFDAFTIEEEKIVPPSFNNYYRIPQILKNSFSQISLKIDFEMYLLFKHTRQALLYKIDKMQSRIRVNKAKPGDIELKSFNKVAKVFQTAATSYKMKHYEGEVLIFYAKEHYYFTDSDKGIIYKRIDISDDVKNAWKKHAKSVKIYEIDGEHSSIFSFKHATGLVEILRNQLDNINNAKAKAQIS
jgi:amino acid adenylation domain-containing protein